ncbi:YkyA family protein [Mesobacillus sp. AQ2]|uniref:YkyA family protein n=1 Tax=unclassified Mesobacillus TaxID=2675270 RepID=UPI0020413DE2|nr:MULTISPECIES: YkyA family protein [unclassified Mesobacillus]MCM3123479.1 YkyA family protein [Mesobacillus sp. MER 33]MCM3233038.1 YkyA family protein [Mesobacillus sp. MER 48]WHX42113.1 YkyA family protein [Mesobacillus sp. AQ2]
MLSIFKKISLAIIMMAGVFSLAGCLDKQSPEEKMFEELEKVVSIEKTFEDQQDPLVELEKKEKEIYEKIISLGMKEYDQIVKLADEALANADKRAEHIDKEKESIDESRKEFKNIDQIIEEIEDSGLKKQANELKATMNERYEIHDDLYKNYKQGLQYDKKLYEMLKDKELSFDNLEEQINKVNEIYETVLKDNQEFNDKTDQYNKEKLAFYKKAGIEVSPEKEE